MIYMGSKARHAKDIIPHIMSKHNPDMWYIEPFVGGCNMIDKIDPVIAPKRLGCDTHEYLISLWKAVSNGWIPPQLITEEDYKQIRDNKEKYPPELVGYVGFALSFGGKWFGGYRRDVAGTGNDPELKRENEINQSRKAYNSSLKQFPKLTGVKFKCVSVFDLNFVGKEPCTIYCDPPYFGTTKYKDDFNHDKFYEWIRQRHNEGHKVYISEYSMPKDFKIIWEKEVNNSLTREGGKKGVEKLFTLG